MRLSSTLEMDFSFQKDTMYRRMRRLICFDMDSTLIETEVIDELAKRAGVGEQVQEITERAMRGEIDFRESFKERVALLKGLDESVMKDIAENLPITEGVERLMYCTETLRLQDSYPVGRIHLFRQLPERTFRHRLCICQQSGNSRRQTHRTLCW